MTRRYHRHHPSSGAAKPGSFCVLQATSELPSDDSDGYAHLVASASADLKKGGSLKALTGHGKEIEKCHRDLLWTKPPSLTSPSSMASPQMSIAFSLVRRFTFHSSPTEISLPTSSPFSSP
ncbi:hypothetical protein DFH11DRAFT_1731472 [Phellopilus nigrolimitatus]|nr:hypothetical protein DFH11DRAFT_1731472 [Phellopilus nigrolimitatus]